MTKGARSCKAFGEEPSRFDLRNCFHQVKCLRSSRPITLFLCISCMNSPSTLFFSFIYLGICMRVLPRTWSFRTSFTQDPLVWMHLLDNHTLCAFVRSCMLVDHALQGMSVTAQPAPSHYIPRAGWLALGWPVTPSYSYILDWPVCWLLHPYTF